MQDSHPSKTSKLRWGWGVYNQHPAPAWADPREGATEASAPSPDSLMGCPRAELQGRGLEGTQTWCLLEDPSILIAEDAHSTVLLASGSKSSLAVLEAEPEAT